MSKITVRRSTFVLIAVVLLFGGTMCATSVSAQSADGEIAVSPTEVSVTQGESQTIAVTYERVSDATPQGIEYTVAYDPAVISVTNQEQGSYLGGDALINNVSSPGEVEYAEVALDGDSVETTNGTVATITVEAASDVDDGATTPLEFTTAKASEGSTEFTITTTNGTVEAEVPTQEEGSTDTDSDGEETTDEDADSEETTEKNADSEETTDDTENDGNRTEDVDNATSENETRTEAELNETADTETSSSTTSEQPANDSSTGNSTTPEDDTSGAIPGFGIKLSLIAVLAITYIVGRKTH
jgi:hypothetical protein